MQVRTATAFRWRPTMLPAVAADVVRVCRERDVTLVLLGNGYECGFSTCWPPASRMILDRFEVAWPGTAGATEARLDLAFAEARTQFEREAPALITPDADFPDDLPGAVLLAVAIHGGLADVRWIGGDVAMVVRDGAVIAATTPHTLRQQVRVSHGDEVDLAQVPNILVRTIGPKAPDRDPPAEARFALAPGDTLIALSKAFFRSPDVPPATVAAAAATLASPSALAEHLAALAFASDDVPYAAVAVVRV